MENLVKVLSSFERFIFHTLCSGNCFKRHILFIQLCISQDISTQSWTEERRASQVSVTLCCPWSILGHEAPLGLGKRHCLERHQPAQLILCPSAEGASMWHDLCDPVT